LFAKFLLIAVSTTCYTNMPAFSLLTLTKNTIMLSKDSSQPSQPPTHALGVKIRSIRHYQGK